MNPWKLGGILISILGFIVLLTIPGYRGFLGFAVLMISGIVLFEFSEKEDD